jgi:hypothetical protein
VASVVKRKDFTAKYAKGRKGTQRRRGRKASHARLSEGSVMIMFVLALKVMLTTEATVGMEQKTLSCFPLDHRA